MITIENDNRIREGIDLEDAVDDNVYFTSIVQLRQIINTICTFNDANDCIDFLNDVKEEKIFVIVSDFLSERIIPFVHGYISTSFHFYFLRDLVSGRSFVLG